MNSEQIKKIKEFAQDKELINIIDWQYLSFEKDLSEEFIREFKD